MTVVAASLFSPTLLTNIAATYYTSPANTRTLIKKLTFTNTGPSSYTITVYRIPFGNTASTSNMLINAQPIAMGETYECYPAEGHMLNVGDYIQALCSTTGVVNIQASGAQFV